MRVPPREIAGGLSIVGWFGQGRRDRVLAPPRGIWSMVVNYKCVTTVVRNYKGTTTVEITIRA